MSLWTKKNHVLTSLLMSVALVGCNGGGNSTTSNTPSFTVTNVSVGQMDDDAANSAEFSTTISFTYSGTATDSWQFGFYMPRSFASLTSTTQSINPKLVMQICELDKPTNCSKLQYQKASKITENDLSTGYTTILAPKSSFSLVPGKQYKISLLHNNQWNAGNYSAAPQSFFISSGTNIANNTPESSLYKLLDYNADTTDNAINTHISTNWSSSNNVVSAVNIVPSPVNYVAGSGSFTLSGGLVIHNLLTGSDNSIANFFKTDLAKDLLIVSSIDNISATSGIILKTISDPALIANNPEGYLITISNTAITIEASNNTGAFYALQSLRQLWNQSPTIAAATITDYPRFKYRGVVLDTARHFFSVPEIESLIDIAATHKLNTLHMHFADDEGFRLGLTDYNTIPTLADTRGYSNSIIALMFIQANLDKTNFNKLVYPSVNTSYSGTYSVSDLEQLITFANQRGVTVIPEIDMPGHARALIKAFPNELVDPNDLSQYVSVQGYTDDVLPVCTYATTTSVGAKFTPLINKIVMNTAKLFNNQTTLYAVNNEISVGGDEVSSGAWTTDSSCSGSWASLNSLEKSHKFFQLLSSNNANLKFSGWQQYVQSDGSSLGNNIVPAANSGHVWVWNTSGVNAGQAQAKTLAEAGYPVVLDYADKTYFDLTYTPKIDEPGFSWAAPYLDTYSALDSARAATQTINGIDSSSQANILGLEGTLWSENLANYDHMIYMALPKMAGLSEAAWSPVNTTDNNNLPNWQSLANRLGCGQSGFLTYLSKLYGVHYRGYPNGISLEAPTACTDI